MRDKDRENSPKNMSRQIDIHEGKNTNKEIDTRICYAH